MKNPLPTLLCLLCFACLSSNAQQIIKPTHTPDSEKIIQLSQDPHWLALGYYKKTGKILKKWQSEVDDDRFFLAINGKTDPLSELKASVDHFFLKEDKASYICQFPARYYWLAKQFKKKNTRESLLNCKAFLDWEQKVNADSVSVIFPASYLDSPSSMFGHTLLRLDKKTNEDKTGLLSYAVSYAAQKKETDSEIGFVYRGLVGGYPGEIATLPYYLKIKEYNDVESRDIWEYKLELSNEEVKQLVRHIWEIKDLNFDYFFFTENCSYRVIAILNIIRPTEKLLDNYPTYTIPISTIQDLLKNNFVKQIKYRPSAITRFNHIREQLTPEQTQQVFKVINEPVINIELLKNTHEDEQKIILEAAYAYSRLKQNNNGQAAQKSFSLLSARNLLEGKSSLNPAPTPAKRDDEGHTSERAGISFGRLSNNNFTEIDIRPAYHDLTDPALGYPIGSELLFSQAKVRIYEDEDIELDEYTLIGIKSIKSRNEFFKPTSWSVGIDATRDTLNNTRRLTPRLQGQLGYAYTTFQNTLIYGLAGGELLVGSKLQKGIDTIAKFNTGFLWRLPKTQLNIEWVYRDSFISGLPVEKTLSTQSVYSLTGNLAVKTFFERKFLSKNNTNEYGLTLQLFF